MRFHVAVCFAVLLAGQYATGADATGAIKAVLTTQGEAWNRGDLEGFMSSYAEDCKFMGTPVTHGRPQVLARYRKVYPTGVAMGKLTFDSLDVRPLDSHFATVTGNWHLLRETASGGDVGGYFSLVLKKKDGQWQILLDHTSLVKALVTPP